MAVNHRVVGSSPIGGATEVIGMDYEVKLLPTNSKFLILLQLELN